MLKELTQQMTCHSYVFKRQCTLNYLLRHSLSEYGMVRRMNFLIKCAELTRTGVGLPAYYNDEVIIPALMSREVLLLQMQGNTALSVVLNRRNRLRQTVGMTRHSLICVVRLNLCFSNGVDKGAQISIKTGNVEDMTTFEEFYNAYKAQETYMIGLMVNAINAIDTAHSGKSSTIPVMYGRRLC